MIEVAESSRRTLDTVLEVALSDARPASVRLESPPGSSTSFIAPGWSRRAWVVKREKQCVQLFDSDSHEGGWDRTDASPPSSPQAHCHRFGRAGDACCGDLPVSSPAGFNMQQHMNRRQQNHRTPLGQWPRRCFCRCASAERLDACYLPAVDRDKAMAHLWPDQPGIFVARACGWALISLDYGITGTVGRPTSDGLRLRLTHRLVRFLAL